MRAKGYEEWKEPKVIASMYSGTAAEGIYISTEGERMYTSLRPRRRA